MIAHLMQHVKVSTDPRLKIEEGALALGKNGKPRLIKSTAGEMIVVEKGRMNGIGVLEPGRLGPEVFTLVDYLKRDIETQQFMQPTAQGVVQPGHITAQEAARADVNAHDMIMMRAVLNDKWIEGIAACVAEFIQEYYDANRRINIIGTDGSTQNDVMTDQLKKVEWSLEIEPGSTLPFDEDKQKQDYAAAYKFLGDPVANPLLEDMLRILKIANRNKILTKHQQTQVFRQFIALSTQVVSALQQMQSQTQGTQGQAIPPEQIQQQMQAMQGQIMQKVMVLMQQVSQTTQQKGTAA